MHDFLAAKVPDVELDALNLPLLNVDAFGDVLVRIEMVVEQAVHQGSFANVTLANDQEFGFVERFGFPEIELEEVCGFAAA